MNVIYATEPMPTEFSKAIFLAGPTPRRPDVPSWRPEALDLLADSGYDGVVFVPEDRSGQWRHDYDDQVEWEEAGRAMADAILFWVPRDLDTMPGYTTNVEFGLDLRTGKVLLGAPPEAAKMKYLAWQAERYYAPQFDNLAATTAKALEALGDGARRRGGECQVPLSVWRTPAFQSWYASQRQAGNRLDGAGLEWVFYTRQGQNLFCWILHVKVWVAAEQRHKSNEFIIGRPDIACVLLYRPDTNLRDTPVVLVREFRSTARTADGFIRELPGGSSADGQDGSALAADELAEETGFAIDASRLHVCGSLQLAGTFATHHASLYAAPISPTELDWFRRQDGKANGVESDTERTYVEVRTIGEIIDRQLTDWSTLGMILSAVTRQPAPA